MRAVTSVHSFVYAEVPTLLRWETDPNMKMLPSVRVAFPKISFAVSNS